MVNSIAFAQANDANQTAVKVNLVEQVTAQPTIWRFGKLVTQRDSEIAAQVQGQVKWMLQQGEPVTAKQVIAKLDDSVFQLSKDKKQAQIDKIKANLSYLTNEVERLSSLVQQQSSSQTQLEEVMALAQAEEAELSAQIADLAVIQKQIEFCNIRAPFDGILVSRLVEIGEVVSIGDSVSRIVDTLNKDLRVMVPLSAWQYLALDDQLSVRSNNNYEELSIRQIIPVAQTNSQMMEVLLNANKLLWPIGIDAEVAVPQSKEQESLLVSRDALVIRRNNTFVYRVTSDNTVEQIRVKVGKTLDDKVIVQGNLQRGDQVVTRGAERLLPNAQVQILSDEKDMLRSLNAAR